jgi:hypothetical protein
MSKRWNKDHATTYFGQNLRSVVTPSTANDFINTDDGQFVFSMWTAKINGSYEFPWQIRVTPALRYQSGQPYISPRPHGIGGAGTGINYGTQRILMELLARGRRTTSRFDIRAESYFNLGGAANGLFFDVYNLTNRRPAEHHVEQRIRLERPASCRRPSPASA